MVCIRQVVFVVVIQAIFVDTVLVLGDPSMVLLIVPIAMEVLAVLPVAVCDAVDAFAVHDVGMAAGIEPTHLVEQPHNPVLAAVWPDLGAALVLAVRLGIRVGTSVYRIRTKPWASMVIWPPSISYRPSLALLAYRKGQRWKAVPGPGLAVP